MQICAGTPLRCGPSFCNGSALARWQRQGRRLHSTSLANHVGLQRVERVALTSTQRRHILQLETDAQVEGVERSALAQHRHILQFDAVAQVEGVKGAALAQPRHILQLAAVAQVQGVEQAAVAGF